MRQSGRALILVPIMYVAIILGLLVLQFSGGDRFTRSVGPLTLRASRGAPSADGTPSVSSVALNFVGLSFLFDEDQGLIVEQTSDVTDQRVTGFQSLEDGFLLEFEGGFTLAFAVGIDPRELRVSLRADGMNGEIPLERIREFSIPFSLERYPPERGEAMSFAAITLDDGDYYLTAPPDAVIDLRNEKLVLGPAAIGQSIRYVEAAEGDPGRVVELFRDRSRELPEAAYRAEISSYIDAAYEGWRTARYRSAGLLWDQGGGSVAFSESALTAYLAEAWRRNEYERAFSEMRRAVDLHPDALTILSSPFLGNLRAVRARTESDDRTRSAAIADRIAERDVTVLAEDDVFRFVADRGSEGLYAELLSFASSTDLRAADLRTAVGVLLNLTLRDPPDARAEQLALTAADLIQETILGAVTQTDRGFFVQDAPGQLDVALTVHSGLVMEVYGAARGDQLVRTIGRVLVRSALELSDPSGFLPASLIVRGEGVETGGGTIAPEELYPLIAANEAYPRQISLYRQLGSGHWIWTISGVRTVALDQERWEFELSYPRLRTHYVLMQGVPEFVRMELFGQTWRNAPDFEIYSKGRHYNDDTGTLMIKYYDNSVSRPVRIFF